MYLPYGEVMKVVRPLHGIPESSPNWYLTSIDYHLNKLGWIEKRWAFYFYETK